MFNKLKCTLSLKKELILKIAKIMLFLFLGVHLTLYILFFSKCLFNSDTAFIVDYSVEALKYKTFFPMTWTNTNDFWIYSLIPLIIPLLKLGINYIITRQLAVIIQTVVLFIVIYDLYKNVLKDKKGLIIFSLILLTGISGQVMFEVFSDATYGTIVFYIIFELYLLLKYLKLNKKKYLVIFSIVLTLLTCCSVRFPVNIASPIICCLLYFIYEKDDMKEKKKYLLIILLICISTLLGFIGHKYLETHLRIENRVNSFPLIHSVENMDEGLVHIAFNYLSLMGSTDQNILSLSIRVKNNIIKNDTFFTLFSLIRFIYAIVTLIVPFILLKKFKKFNDLEKTVYIYVCSQVFILYFFFLIGNMYEWYRYVTPLIISLNMLYPLLYKYYLSDTKKHRISFNISLSAICITALFFVISSYYNFETHKFRENPYQELVNLLLENDLHFGYTYTGREHNLYFTLSNGQITAGRLDYDGTPDYWLTSTDWYKDDYYDGKVFFLRRRREYRFSFEEKAIDVLHFKHYDITVFEKLSDITSTFDKKEKEDKND